MDEVGFFGSSFVPSEVRAVQQVLVSSGKIDQTQLRKVLKCVLQQLQSQSPQPHYFSDEHFHQLSLAIKLPKSTFTIVFTGLLIMFRMALRSKTKIEEFQHILTDMKIPESFAADIVKSFQSSRGILEESAVSRAEQTLSRLSSMKWRVDVTISTTSLSRVLKPSLLFQFTTLSPNNNLNTNTSSSSSSSSNQNNNSSSPDQSSDGADGSSGGGGGEEGSGANDRMKTQTLTFEVPIDKFHELRYAVTKILKDMDELVKHPILKVDL